MNTRDTSLPGHGPVPFPALAEPALSEAARAVAARLGERRLTPGVLAGLVRLAEFGGLAVLGALLYLGYARAEGIFLRFYLVPVLAGAAAFVAAVQLAGGYRISALKAHLPQLGRVYAAWTLVFAGLAVAAFFFQVGIEYSRAWFAAWYVAGLVVLTAWRVLLARLVRRWSASGTLHRRAVIVGGGRAAAELIAAIEHERESDLRICGIFDDRGDDRSPAVTAGYPKLGTISELVEFARIAEIDMLIVAMPLSAEDRLMALLKKLWVLPVDIRLSALSSKLRFRPRSYSYIGSVPFLDLFDRPIAGWQSVEKRAFDIVFASLALVVLSPIMLAAALAVKLDSPGPVLFRQKRYGFNNEVIEVLKFRSMYHGRTDHFGRQSVTRGDPRVTRVGRFIRRSSIDELPQLVNVLKGELSLVGPRPHAPMSNTDDKLWDAVVDGYFARHRVKPGVTGWAQVNGWRGEVDRPEKIQRRVDFDLDYIERWSVLFDLYILAITPFRLFGQENAY